MSFFDQMYDEMSWKEVCCRLPNKMAVNAINRRINNLETLRMFFENIGKQPNSIKEIKQHINDIVRSESSEDVLDLFAEKHERTLFDWMDEENIKRLRDGNKDKLSLKFLFNSTNGDDRDGMIAIMDKILSAKEFIASHLRSVINKVSDRNLNPVLDMMIKDDRPEVRVCVLEAGTHGNYDLIGDRYKTIGLKAMAKCDSDKPLPGINRLSVNIFSNLKPLERLLALEKYFGYFPKYKKIMPFNPSSSAEEFETILFSGCMLHFERVNKLKEEYNKITTLDPPE